MITCKEDLTNTYIKNDGGELRDLYISKLKEFGIYACGGYGFDYLYRKSFIGVRDWGEGGQSEWNHAPFDRARELTLKDLKPTPTKFVKVEESIFDLKGEFERGELYQKPEFARDYSVVSNVQALAGALNGGFCYRQVEIDWRDEVVKSLPAGYGVESFGGKDIRVNGMFNKEQSLILANAIIASLTEKQEGV